MKFALFARDKTCELRVRPCRLTTRVAAILALAGGLGAFAVGTHNAHAQTVSLPGKFQVSAVGAVTYAIPVTMPPSTAGIAPTLTLQYSSFGGDGLLGLGWNLGGLPSIARCPRSVAQDGALGTVSYDANDRFCIDGQRLVAISGTYGADGTQYRTEIETFSRIISHGTAGSGPSWFEVRTRSGRIMEFGHTTDSLVLAQGKASARAWALNRVSDTNANYTNANYYTVAYSNDATNGQYYPNRIDFTGNTSAGLSPFNSVQFVYATRPDIVSLYKAGSLIRNTQRLTNVKTFTGSTLVTNYQLTYQATGASRSQIVAVTLCVRDGSCMPATRFAWTARGRVSSITSGLGLSTAITYSPLTDNSIYTLDKTSAYPKRDFAAPWFVVSRVDAANGLGGSYSSTYSYAGARVDLTGRGFLGFRQTLVTDLQTHIASTTNYRQDFPYLGLVASTTKSVAPSTPPGGAAAQGMQVSQSTNSYQFSNASGTATVSTPSASSAPYQVSISQNVSSGADLDGSSLPTTTTNYQYDAYGNATQVASSTSDGVESTTVNSYSNDTTNWFLGRLTKAAVTKTALGSGQFCALPWGASIANGQSVTAYSAANPPPGQACSAIAQTRTCTAGTLSGNAMQQSCAALCALPWGGTISVGQTVTAYSAAGVPAPQVCSSAAQTRTCGADGILTGSFTNQSCSVRLPQTLYLTSGSTWAVPNNWNNAANKIEVIGGGGSGWVNGGAGGGGGGYSSITNLTLTPGSTISYNVGLGGNGSAGGDTWFNGGSLSGASVSAQGGAIETNLAGGPGGQASSGIGTTKYSGGYGGVGRYAGGGGGGAAGPHGNGGNGGNSGGITLYQANENGGGGAGADGGSIGGDASSGATGAGGNGLQGTGGSGNCASGAGGAGGSGGYGGDPSSGYHSGWYGCGGSGSMDSAFDAGHGSGGGGGGGGANNFVYGSTDSTGWPGGAGAGFGGGGGGGGAIGASGGPGGNGVIVITYTPAF